MMLGMIVAAVPAFALDEPKLPDQSDSLPSDIEPPLLLQNLAPDDSTLDPQSTLGDRERPGAGAQTGSNRGSSFPGRYHRQGGSGTACAESCATRGDAGRGAAGRNAESRVSNGQTQRRRRDLQARGGSANREGAVSPRRAGCGLAQPAAPEKAPCLGQRPQIRRQPRGREARRAAAPRELTQTCKFFSAPVSGCFSRMPISYLQAIMPRVPSLRAVAPLRWRCAGVTGPGYSWTKRRSQS